MNTSLPTFPYAQERVKISHFTRQGYDISGIVHVGANDGEEVEYYLQMGIHNILCFEPLKAPYLAFLAKYAQAIQEGKVKIFNLALGDENEQRAMNVAASNKASSFLVLTAKDKTKPYYQDTVGEELVTMQKFNEFIKQHREIDLKLFDCLVLDVEGYELNVLKNMGKYLQNFKYLNIECSEAPIHAGEASAQTIIDYLKAKGFRQTTPITEHDDILFIKENI